MKSITGAILILAAAVYALAGSMSTANHVVGILHTAMTFPLLGFGGGLISRALYEDREKNRSTSKSDQPD